MAIVACVLAAAVHAQVTDNWSGTSSGLWGTAGNWSGGVPGSSSAATFNTSGGLQTAITLLPSSTAYSLVFSSAGGANNYTFDTLGTQNTDTLTISSGITNSDLGTITLFNATTLAGAQAWTNSGGAMTFDGSVNLGSGSTGYALTINGAGAVNVAGVVANGGTAAGSLVYSGTGTLTLSGANTYTGGATVSSGIVNIQNNSGLGTGAASVTSGATLEVQGGLTNVANAITLNGTGAPGAFGSPYGALDNVSGANTVSGSITLGSATQINSSAGTLSITAGGISGANTNLTVGGAGNTSISGVIGTGSGTLTKTGAGTLTLSGANTFTGATAVNTGILSIQSNDALGTASNTANITVASGAVLQMSNNITTDNMGTLILNGTGAGQGALVNVSGNNTWNNNVTLGSNTTIYSGTAGSLLTIGSASYGTTLFTMGANTVTIAGPGDTWFNSNVGVAGDTGGLVMNSTGTLTLYGYDDYYTGATTVNSGTLDLVLGPLNTGYYGINGSLTIGTGPSNPALAGTVIVNIQTNSYADQISPTSAVTINSDGILNVGAATSTGTLTLNGGQVSITSGITLSPTGDITSNTNSAHQTSLISGGILNPSTGNFNVARDSTLASDLTVSSAIAGTNLTKTGNGILTLTGANTYTGATSINGGTLSVSADNNLGAAPGSATASKLNFNGGTLATTSTFALNSNRGITLNAGGGTMSPSSGTTLTFGGIVAGTGALTVSGAGTVALSGANTYTGATNLNAGTLSISADNNLGTAPGSATASMLNFNGGTLATTAGFTLNANRGITVGAAGGTLNVASGTTLAYGGLLAGTGSLSLPGAGILDLTSDSLNFGGSATVTSGELEVTGKLPTIGTLTLGTGSTLFVNGSDLSVGNLVIAGNAIIDFGSGSPILSAGTFTVDPGAMLTVEGWSNQVDYFYAQNWTGATLGTRGTGPETQVTFSGYSSSSTGWLSYDREISPAPEPGAYGALLAGICLLGVVVHRRKHPAA
jgi:fibronectin-binding autotransporter adhesin